MLRRMFSHMCSLIVIAVVISACAHTTLVTEDKGAFRTKEAQQKLIEVFDQITLGMSLRDVEQAGLPIEACLKNKEPHMKCRNGIRAIQLFLGPTVFGNFFSAAVSGSIQISMDTLIAEGNRYRLIVVEFDTTDNQRVKDLYLLFYEKRKTRIEGAKIFAQVFLRDNRVIYVSTPEVERVDRVKVRETFGYDPTRLIERGVNHMIP